MYILQKLISWVVRYITLLFLHVWPVNQPTVTGVTMCHEKGWMPMVQRFGSEHYKAQRSKPLCILYLQQQCGR